MAQTEEQSSNELVAQLFSCLHREPIIPDTPSMIDPTGDHILNPDFARYNHPSGLRLAAVLIAVEAGASEPEVVLTVRTKNLNAHAGQIAFPGGRVDEGETAEQAAVREACEEIALEPELVSVEGFLDTYASRTGYRVVPVVASVDGWGKLNPNPGEVESIFRVPLRFLLDQTNARMESRVFEGKTRHFYSYTFEDRHIWGLTAGIIHHMSSRVISYADT